MIPEKKILITTVYKNKKTKYDYIKANSRNKLFRLSLPRIESLGLRFIKQNIPSIEILEYPTWEQYKKNISKNNWDIVGFSFYLNETHEILDMVKYARESGIQEIWAGNYGALTDEISKKFDWICIGYGEEEIAKKIGIHIDEIIHPPLVGYIGTPFGIKLTSYAYLSVNRGCNNHCSFCQTPSFCKKPSKLPISSIINVLLYYKKVGVNQIIIPDENFGIFPNHCNKVAQMLGEYGFKWYPMTRSELLNRNFSNWLHNGLGGALVAIESFNQKNMDDVNKKEKLDSILLSIKKLHKENLFLVGGYIIGFENDSIDSIKKSAKILSNLKLDATQITILMPLPKTPLWDYLNEKYGIFEKDWHKYNAKHLVWNHPNIDRNKMKKLLNYTLQHSYPVISPFRTTIKLLKNNSKEYGNWFEGSKVMSKQFINSNKYSYSKHEYI